MFPPGVTQSLEFARAYQDCFHTPAQLRRICLGIAAFHRGGVGVRELLTEFPLSEVLEIYDEVLDAVETIEED